MSEGKKVLEDFGKLLMLRVRDDAIWRCDSLVNGHLKGELAEKVRQELGPLTEKELEKIHKLIPEIVDSVIHRFLFMIEDTRNLRLLYRLDETSEFTDLGEESDGLAGELYASDGWIARFSKARKVR